ncbi:MAG TPA: hypothetical protein VKT25_15855 [Ktedonobacteraceae bacterium]|nr:hypothetical protein [Ktedonobacteraceae bacterium]
MSSRRTRKLAIGVITVLLALFVAACGSTTTTGSVTSTATSATENAIPMNQPMARGAVKVYITLEEYHVVSSLTTFQAGTPYYFVVTNRGHDYHEFMIMPSAPDGSPLSLEAQYKGMMLELEPILPGTTWTHNFTFPTSDVGHFEMACQMGHHYQFGMRLPILVTAAT